jgi:hypothetical protein
MPEGRMEPVQVTVTSNRKFQGEFENEFQAVHPEVDLTTTISKSFDALQITELVIISATLLVETLSLIVAIRNKHRPSKVLIDLKSKGGKTLRIDATDQDIDINVIVSAFYDADTAV